MAFAWHVPLCYVAFLIFLFDMGAPYWFSNDDPLGYGCAYYSGAWGFTYVGDGCANDGGYEEWPEFVYEHSAGGDLETWQAGASLAFIFGLFACIAKTAAYLFDEGGQPGAKQADYAALESRSSSKTKIGLCCSFLCGGVAVLGASISVAGSAMFAGDSDVKEIFAQEFYACFGLQIVGIVFMALSAAMDVGSYLDAANSAVPPNREPCAGASGGV